MNRANLIEICGPSHSTGTPTVTVDATGAIKYVAGSLGASGTIDLDPIEITAKATQ